MTVQQLASPAPQIDLDEFTYLHSMIVKGAMEAAEKDAEAARKIAIGEQRARFLKVSVTILLIGLLFMLAGERRGRARAMGRPS